MIALWQNTLRTLTMIALALTAAGSSFPHAHAHDEILVEEEVPLYSRAAATRAYMRGGPIARAGLESQMARIPGADANAVTLGRDLDGDGDPDEVHIRLEVVEIQEEVYPGEFVTFWVFAPLGRAMTTGARLPSPTIRVEEGDHVTISLYNTHYLPHTIHLHGTIHPYAMDGVPDMSQKAVAPGEVFEYSFVAKNPGTHYYHCHVHPAVHIQMGLAGMLIIEPNRPNNHFAHLIPGGGRIEHMAAATREEYDAEYSLIYMDIDDRLNRIPAAYADPREIEMRMHRHFDPTQRQPNIFLLNGRSFPYTVYDTPIQAKSDALTKLRILNVGERTVNLHTHGHHPTMTHLDGYPVADEARITRDVFRIGSAQRLDLALRTGDDDFYASGAGVWLMHNHSQSTQSNKGMQPGGDKTVIVYDSFVGADGLPRGIGGHLHHLDAAYYQGRRPVFDPDIFGSTLESYESGWLDGPPAGGQFEYPVRQEYEGTLPRLDLIDAQKHRLAATACSERPRSFRRILIKAGREFAREGEVFGFEPREIHAEPCEEVEIVLENTDSVRHDLMIPGLSPVFALNFIGPGTQTGRFLTPDEDVTLMFHCHVQTHDEHGMLGQLIVGAGSDSPQLITQVGDTPAAELYHGVGVVIATLPRMSRLIVNHDEIEGFMAAMEMSYPVASPDLLAGLETGDQITFTIDAQANQIIAIEVTRPAAGR